MVIFVKEMEFFNRAKQTFFALLRQKLQMMTKFYSLSLRRFFYVFFLVPAASFMMSAKPVLTQNPNHYIYKIKVDMVEDPISFKELSGELYDIFDSRPRFQDAQDVIMITSVVDISEARLSMKLTALGYTLHSFHKSADHQSPK